MDKATLSKRVLFCGYYGMDNVGDDSFGAVLTWGARQYWGTRQPLLLSKKEVKGKVKTQPACIERRIFPGQIIPESFWQILRASCVIWGGGSILHSGAPRWTPKHFSFVASGLGLTPAGAIGVSLGPYKSVADEKAVHDYLRQLKFLTVRDRASYQDALSRELPYQPVLAADLAMLLPRMAPEMSCAPPADQLLGITVCHYERYRGQSMENELRRETTLLEGLLGLVRNGYRGRLRFFIFNANRFTGDHYVTMKFYNKLKDLGARVELVPYQTDPIAIWGQVAQCSAMISTRLHGAVFAAAANVPCCLIEYHRKCTDFVTDAGVDPRWVLGDADCSAETLSGKLEALLLSDREAFYPNRTRLIEMAEKNFTFEL